MIKPKIVCLCGSTRFRDAFVEANFVETLRGNIVLGPGVFIHDGVPESLQDGTEVRDAFEASGNRRFMIKEEVKVRLDALHLKKIDLADEVLVVNPNNYIGESTDKEIKYAYARGKIVRFLDEAGEVSYRAWVWT